MFSPRSIWLAEPSTVPLALEFFSLPADDGSKVFSFPLCSGSLSLSGCLFDVKTALFGPVEARSTSGSSSIKDKPGFGVLDVSDSAGVGFWS